MQQLISSKYLYRFIFDFMGIKAPSLRVIFDGNATALPLKIV